MKKLLCMLCALSLVALTACSSANEEKPADSTSGSESSEVTYTAGTYTGSADGKMGPVTVSVTLSDDAIESIEVTEHAESRGIADAAFEHVINDVLEYQTLNVDAVSGCTLTRMGVLGAITNALENAGADVDALKKGEKPVHTGTAQELDTDVVIIGSGVAGLTAALEAAYAGADVVVVEKLAYVGGSSLLSSAMMVVGGSKLQAEAGIEDSVENLKEYWIERGEGNINEEFTNYAAEHINEALDWFIDLGVQYIPSLILQSGTATINRAHLPVEAGRELLPTLQAEAEAHGVKFLTNTTVNELIIEDGVVKGVKAKNYDSDVTVNAKSTIIATGGFAASQEKIAEYSPNAKGSLYVGCVGATGDGIDLGLSAGADTVFKGGYIGWKAVTLQYDHTHPIGAPLYGAQNLLVNAKGDRITNETLDYPFIYEDMAADGSDTFYAIFQSAAGETVDLVGNQSTTIPNLELGVEAGVCYKADTLEELAKVAGLDNIVETVETFNASIEAGKDEAFGRDTATMETIENGPFYALQWKQALLGTFGGLKVNLQGEVLDTDGNAIDGLYAAGEVCNGEFFPKLYPASGSAVDQAVTFGREAGKSAAANAAE